MKLSFNSQNSRLTFCQLTVALVSFYFLCKETLTLGLLPAGHNHPSLASAFSMFHQVVEWQQYISLKNI